MKDFLDYSFLNNTMLDYLLFLITIITGILAVKIIKLLFIKRISAWAVKTSSDTDNYLICRINKNIVPLLYFGVLYLATRFLNLSRAIENFTNIIILAFIFLFGAIFISSALVFLFKMYWQKKNNEVDPFASKWISNIIKIIIWLAALLLFFDNIGFKITTLVAGLGIGGIAIAFAAQTILEDIFSFVTIFFDKPFELGDYIVIGDLSGTIEKIGIKTTRIRSISGEQLVLSNKDLTGSRLRNYKRMQKRRASFQLGVTYNTPIEKLKEIPEILKQIIIDIGSEVSFDRAHFSSFGDSSLVFEIVYYVLSQEYIVYMNAQQKINFTIKEKFEADGIEFAFPTQTVYIQKEKEE